jgi:hypothetical protein
MDARGLRGGGPIDPSTPRIEDFDADAASPFAVPLARTLFPRAEAFTDDAESVSREVLRSLLTVLLASDITEDGRETVGVLKTEESRR